MARLIRGERTKVTVRHALPITASQQKNVMNKAKEARTLLNLYKNIVFLKKCQLSHTAHGPLFLRLLARPLGPRHGSTPDFGIPRAYRNKLASPHSRKRSTIE